MISTASVSVKKSELKNLSDDQLMALVAADSNDALDTLWKRYHRLTQNYARKLVHDPYQAQDIISIAFARIWKSRGHFCKHRGTFKAWMMRIIRNLAFNANRNHRRYCTRYPSLEELLDTNPCPSLKFMTASAEKVALEQITRSEIFHQLDRVPEPYKETLTMWISNPNTEEIATMLNIAKGTIRSRMNRAREFLNNQPVMREILAA